MNTIFTYILPAPSPFSTSRSAVRLPQRTEGFLTSAGFKTKAPFTVQQQQHFKALTPYKLMTVHRHGKTYYVYADPAQNQLYIGNHAQYQRYQQIRQVNELALEVTAQEALLEESGDCPCCGTVEQGERRTPRWASSFRAR